MLGVIFPCDRCDYTATEAVNLNMHKESVHGDINMKKELVNALGDGMSNDTNYEHQADPTSDNNSVLIET